MRSSLSASAVVLVALGLTGCGGAAPEVAPKTTDVFRGEISEAEITLRDGREVTCLVFAGMRKGGLSCDWRGAR